MKKYFTLFALMISTLTAFAEEVLVDGIKYNIISKALVAEVINANYVEDIVIPETITVDGKQYTVTSIGKEAFDSCIYLSSVSIPNTVTSIGESAFNGCISLTNVNIPTSVTSLGSSAFDGCSSLSNIVLPNSLTTIEGYTFRRCTHLDDITIPSSITKIGKYAFTSCYSFNNIIIPNSVTTIAMGAFSGCTNLTNITIPNSITYIDEFLFAGCSSLTKITIPNSVKVINSSAFNACTGLTSVFLGTSIHIIDERAFRNCTNLETVTCMATKVPSAYSTAFEGSLINYSTLIVPEASLQDYKNTSPWSDFGTFKALEYIDDPTAQKCATPTITYADGKLSYTTDTEGATVVSEVKSDDIKMSYDNEVSLTGIYTITAYATKPGMDNSDVATATLVWVDASFTMGEPITSVKNINTSSLPVLISSNSGNLTISGMEEGMAAVVYGTDGKMLDSSRAIGNTTTLNATALVGNVAIIKIGNKIVKVAVR